MSAPSWLRTLTIRLFRGNNRHLLPAGVAVLSLAAPAPAQIVILHSFTGGASGGRGPQGSLIESGSTLYGMTLGTISPVSNAATIFEIGTDGSGFTNLHIFAGGSSDGLGPWGSLIQSGSALYGMTYKGGSNSQGTIFQIGTDGTGFNLLHSFNNSAGDGEAPYGSLTQSGSTLYGMTNAGGSNGQGTIFQIGTNGTGFSVMHSFTPAEGGQPYGSLIQSGSTLYGMSSGSSGMGASGGTIFQIGTNGTGFSVLHAFSGPDNPMGSLVEVGSTLYGMGLGGDLFRIGIDGTG